MTVRDKNRNIRSKNKSNNNSRFLLTPDTTAFHIRQSIDGTQHAIDLAMKHYDKTGDLYALQIAFDGCVQLGEMYRKVKELYSYGHDYELTK
jgi:hypothetical protein